MFVLTPLHLSGGRFGDFNVEVLVLGNIEIKSGDFRKAPFTEAELRYGMRWKSRGGRRVNQLVGPPLSAFAGGVSQAHRLGVVTWSLDEVHSGALREVLQG